MQPNVTYGGFDNHSAQRADHDTSGVHFLVGHGVNRGIYGERPNLTTFDRNGNLTWQIDFRSYYGSVLHGRLGDPRSGLREPRLRQSQLA